MKKKVKRRHSVHKHSTYKNVLIVSYRNTAIIFTVLLFVVGGFFVKASGRTHVLGTSTERVLPQGTGDSGPSGNFDSDLNDLNSLDSEINNLDNIDTSTQSVTTDTTQVDCVGPDGKHFTTMLKTCAILNKGWNNGKFTFTPLNATSHITPMPETPDLQGSTVSKINTTKFGAHRENEMTTFDVNGEPVELINSATQGAIIRHRGTEANSNFPLSIDPKTDMLTVTTPAGVKQVTVLPDQAVQNLLQNKVFTGTQSQGSTISAEPAITSQTATLTDLNNEPVFEVNGISQKKFLGIIPVGFNKTAFVSAQSGQVVKVDESLLNKFLETLSF